MQNIIDYMETIPRTELQEKVLKFLKDQEFIKEHIRKGGDTKELKKLGFQFGKIDITKLNQDAPEPKNTKLHPVLQALLAQRKFFKQHIEQGGSLTELKQKGYKFGTINLPGY